MKWLLKYWKRKTIEIRLKLIIFELKVLEDIKYNDAIAHLEAALKKYQNLV